MLVIDPKILLLCTFALALGGCEDSPPSDEDRDAGELCGHDLHCKDALVCDYERCRDREPADFDDDDGDAGGDAGGADGGDDGGASSDSACFGDSLTQVCDSDADCCASEACFAFGGLERARCSGRCGIDGDCETDCCQNGRCVPADYCAEPEPDPCSDCLESCRGLPSCCTGVGCICDSAC